MDLVPKAVRQLAKEGFRAGRVECRNGFIARDLFKFADVLGIKTAPDILDDRMKVALIQVTSRSNVASRKKKVLENVDQLIHPDVLIEVWGYDGGKLARRERLVEGLWIKLA